MRFFIIEIQIRILIKILVERITTKIEAYNDIISSDGGHGGGYRFCYLILSILDFMAHSIPRVRICHFPGHLSGICHFFLEKLQMPHGEAGRFIQNPHDGA